MSKEGAETLSQTRAVLTAMACRLVDLADELEQLSEGEPVVPPAAAGTTYWTSNARPVADLIRQVAGAPKRTG
jgi:hypothetical protein